MKKQITLLSLILLTNFCNAQIGVLSGMAGSIINNRPILNTQKHFFATAQMHYPINIFGGSLSGSKMTMPPIFLSAEYGVQRNITFGATIGRSSSESNGTVASLAQNIINGDLNLNDGGSLLDIAQDLLLNGGGSGSGSTTSQNYTIKRSMTYIGLSVKYHFVGGKKSSFYLANRSGIRIATSSKTVGVTGNALVDQVINNTENLTPIFSGFSGGGYFYFDKNYSWSFNPELGYGFGYGDGLQIAGNPILISVGLAYHIKPKKPAAQITR